MFQRLWTSCTSSPLSGPRGGHASGTRGRRHDAYRAFLFAHSRVAVRPVLLVRPVMEPSSPRALFFILFYSRFVPFQGWKMGDGVTRAKANHAGMPAEVRRGAQRDEAMSLALGIGSSSIIGSMASCGSNSSNSSSTSVNNTVQY